MHYVVMCCIKKWGFTDFTYFDASSSPLFFSTVQQIVERKREVEREECEQTEPPGWVE